VLEGVYSVEDDAAESSGLGSGDAFEVNAEVAVYKTIVAVFGEDFHQIQYGLHVLRVPRRSLRVESLHHVHEGLFRDRPVFECFSHESGNARDLRAELVVAVFVAGV
jgi:hypothetical protein